MAYVNFWADTKANLPTTKQDNTLYFVTDTGAIYKGSTLIASKNTAGNGISVSGTEITNDAAVYFVPQNNFTTTAGVSNSLSTKWTVSGVDGITVPFDGMTIIARVPAIGVKTAGVVMSIDNGTTYYPVVQRASTTITSHYPVGSPVMLTFNPTQKITAYLTSGTATSITGCWQVGDYDANANTIPSAYCDTSAATAAKTASCTNYTLLSKSYLHVLIRYSNTVKNKLTLNVNSQGAKSIYINGAVSSATNYTLPAGTYLVYYDGTNYYFRTDGKLTADITGNAATATTATTAEACSGNAATATKFASAATVAITGDASGSASSQHGWSVDVDVDYSKYLKLQTTSNLAGETNKLSTRASSWGGAAPSTIKSIPWRQAFIDSSISSDSGDWVLGLRPSEWSSGGTELCMFIDGDYYAMGNKVLNTGNYATTLNNAYIRRDGTNYMTAALQLKRKDNASGGRISFYNSDYKTWFEYMSNPGAGLAPNGGQPVTYGDVTSWARRSLIENNSGYGWVWEAASNVAATSNTTTPTAIMSLSSNTGKLAVSGAIVGASSLSIGGDASFSGSLYKKAGGHLYLEGATSTSKDNTTQIIFKEGTTEHYAISSNDDCFVINKTSSDTANQIALYLGDKAASHTSQIPSILQAPEFIGDLTGNASTATQFKDAATVALTGDVTGTISSKHGWTIATSYTNTVPVSKGGTGATTLTSGAALIGNGTGAVTTRSITNMTSVNYITYNTNLMTTNTLAYWNGAYNSSGNSNISYVGTITKGTWSGTTIAVNKGGTGNTSITANRLIYSESASKISSSGHYASSSKIAINSTTAPTETLYVNGDAKIAGDITATNDVIVGSTVTLQYNSTKKSLDFIFA